VRRRTLRFHGASHSTRCAVRFLLENPGNCRALLNAGGAHQYRAPFSCSSKISRMAAVNFSRSVCTRRLDGLHAPCCGWSAPRHIKFVRGSKFLSFRFSGSSHSPKLFVNAKQVLKRNRGHRAAFLLDPHILLGFYGLVEPIAPATSWQNAPR